MTTIKKASKAGARRVTANLDAIASLFQNHAASLGIPRKVAMDFATRCDLLSDSIDRRKQAGYFDPSQIGEEVDGPAVYDDNNPFMEGEFTQEEKRNLSEKQMAGSLAANAAKGVADPKIASAIRKAAYNAAIVAIRAKRAAAKDVEDAKDADDDAKDADDDAKDAEDDAKAQKTAMMAELYNRLRRQAKKAKKSEDEDESEDEPEEDESKEDESEDEDAGEAKDSKKTAKLFNLYA